MNEIFLISENKVRKFSNISTNTQTHTLLPAIRYAHYQYELVVGSKLMKHLQHLVETGEIDKEENYKFKNLLGKSQMFLVLTAVSELIIINAVKIDNFGSSMATDEHIQSLTLNENFKLKDYYTHKAEQELKRLQMFIYQFYDDYKEYMTHTTKEDFRSNLYSSASTPIFLGGGRGRCFKNNSLKNKYE